MKKKLFFFAAIAAMTLCGCQKDNGGENGGGDKDYSFVAVNIAQPKNLSGRANSGDFVYGTDDENTAQQGLFFIFNQAGTAMYGAPQWISLEGNAVTENNPAVEKIYSAVLVIDGVDKDPFASTKQIVCVLNAPAGLEDGVTTLTQLRNKIDDYSISEPGKFIMTNSVYYNGSNAVLGAVIARENVVKSAAEALNNPVDIYVERVVARVQTTAVADMTNNEGANPKVDGVETQFDIKITGIEIANIAETSYLFKNVENIDFTDGTNAWMIDAGNKRSYWETSPESLTYKNQSYNDIIKGFDESDKIVQYIQPNTTAQKTAVLVTAQLLNKGTETPADLVYLRGGYFKNEGALHLIAQYVATEGFWQKTADEPETYSQLSTDCYKWVNQKDEGYENLTWLKSYEVVAQLKEDLPNLYKKAGNNADGSINWVPATAKDVNDLLSGAADLKPLYKARVYTDGMCYYFVNIDQSPIAGLPAGKMEGVVRNHIYDLNLSAIKGIGTPVFDPDDIIIPERPKDEELYYLAAEINVLAWKFVHQDVVFN